MSILTIETMKLFENMACNVHHHFLADDILDNQSETIKSIVFSNDANSLRQKISGKNYFCDTCKVTES